MEKKNLYRAQQLLQRLRDIVGYLVSLGDHFSYTACNFGLAERRLRLAALHWRQIIDDGRWDNVIHVPSDHDLGRPCKLVPDQEMKALIALSDEFEQQPEFRAEEARALPDSNETLMLRRGSDRSATFLTTSCEVFTQYFNDVVGCAEMGAYRLVWLSDVLLEARASSEVPPDVRRLAREQWDKAAALLGERELTILALHNPFTLSVLDCLLKREKLVPSIVLTITGHVHARPIRLLVPRRLRRAFNLTVCPSLTGNRITAGGGMIIREYGERVCAHVVT